MTSQKSQNSNMLLAFLTLLGVIVLVAVVGFFMQYNNSQQGEECKQHIAVL